MKLTMLKDLMLKNIIYQKVKSKIIMWSSMEKTFYDLPIDSDIKRYEKLEN